MRWRIVYVELLLALTVSLAHATHYSRDDSSENAKTEFNLASTYTGGISSNRHHARAHLNSPLYPEITQQPIKLPGAGYASADIDEPSGHESGGSGVGTLDVHVGPAGNRVGIPQRQPVGYPRLDFHYPTLPIEGQAQPAVTYPPGYQANQTPQLNAYPKGTVPGAYPGGTVPGAYPGGTAPGAYPGGTAPGAYPGGTIPGAYPGGIVPGAYPGSTATGAYLGRTMPRAYPGGTMPGAYPNSVYNSPNLPIDGGQQHPYLVQNYGIPPQYSPIYPILPYAAYPSYGPGVPGSVPVVVQPEAPPTSYQNQRHFAPHEMPRQRDHYDHSFYMNTEYKEDGVHKGPFGVLNNHKGQGYGSGFGGGYNGAVNSPGY